MSYFWSTERGRVCEGEMGVDDREATPAEVSEYQARVAQAWLKATQVRIREARKPILDALTGISGRASRASNDSLAAECDALSQQLLDITKQQTVKDAVATGSDDAVDLAVLTLYRQYAATASPAVQTAFMGEA